MDETSGVALALRGGAPTYQIEDEEGRIHLLIHLPIEEEDENRWCLWRPDHAAAKAAMLDAQTETPQNWAVSVKRDLSPRIAAKC
jgi:hypothetical protein